MTAQLEANPAVQQALLGDRQLRSLQGQVIDLIRGGSNVLSVMGTGQGKSVCFQIPAFEAAIAAKKKTIIFYPLRSLANDQYETIKRSLGDLPVRLYRANGSITSKERAALDEVLATGEWDVLIATPEFAMHHADRLGAEHNRPDLVVLDEAHHLMESRHRSAYRNFAWTLEQLGTPQTAAFTATAREETFNHIVETLKIHAWVINPAIRENLHIVDARNHRSKDEYVLKLAKAADGKTIVYCNSRKTTAELAEALKSLEIDGVAYYNAEMPSKERRAVEDAFRSGELRFIVATSAFGEGIDLPNVRDVVLYHLNFDMVSFNQMSGRAGRDGQPARIHLLYGDADRRINDMIMQKACPSVDLLRRIYKDLKRYANGEEIRSTYTELGRILGKRDYDGATVSTALKIFEEVGLAKVEKEGRLRVIQIFSTQDNVDITAAERYEEGQATLEAFDAFCKVAMTYTPTQLQTAISKPIYPTNIELTGTTGHQPLLDW